MISRNVAHGLRLSDAPYMGASFIDVLYPNAKPTESADNIKDRIKAKLRGYE